MPWALFRKCGDENDPCRDCGAMGRARRRWHTTTERHVDGGRLLPEYGLGIVSSHQTAMTLLKKYTKDMLHVSVIEFNKY